MSYIHGFTSEEQLRLNDQARVLANMIYKNLDFTEVDRLLEIGCGTGAQTKILLQKNADMVIDSCDISDVQIKAAKENLAGEDRVNLHLLDGGRWPFEDESFDVVFLCWVIEHVQNYQFLLDEAFRVLKPGGQIMLTEVNNDSLQLLPHSDTLEKYWNAYNELQTEMGGDPVVGVKLGNYVKKSGFQQIETYPLFAHRDQRDPDALIEILDYWENLILSGKDQLLQSGKISQQLVDELKAQFKAYKLDDTTVFFYTGVQAVAKK